MDTVNKSVRLSFDVPQNIHRLLKTIASANGKTIKDIILEAVPYIEETNMCTFPSHEPNQETAKAIRESQRGENLTEYKTVDDMFKKLGIKC